MKTYHGTCHPPRRWLTGQRLRIRLAHGWIAEITSPIAARNATHAELTMIIQINATVCAAVDHGEGGQLNIAGRSWREDGAKGQGRGSYQAEQRIQRARQKCRFLQPMQNGVASRSSSLREQSGSPVTLAAQKPRALTGIRSAGPTLIRQPELFGGDPGRAL